MSDVGLMFCSLKLIHHDKVKNVHNLELDTAAVEIIIFGRAPGYPSR